MSRIGRKAVLIPSSVKVTINSEAVFATGPKGTLTVGLPNLIGAKIEGDQLTFEIIRPSRSASAFLGTTRSLVNSAIKGVVEGFEKKLELVGVGYRARANGSKALTFTVGYSHPVEFNLPEGVTAEVTDNVNLTIRGFDKQLVGQVAANIRRIRKPEPYKGKGIKYAGEVIRRKQGKSGKV